MADNFPIDIDYKKVNDWLYDRKKLSKDWAAKHKALSLKLTDIFNKGSVESEDVKNFMKQNEEKANFLLLSKVIEKVLETDEAKAKNMFGRYTSKNINDLLALKKLYEKDNLHIADMAKIMAQNATFEIPAIKKSVGAFENQIQELAYEEQSYKNSIANSEKEFAAYCEKIGISGEDIHKEVPALIKHLPEIFDKFVALLQTPLFRETLDYYYNFTRYSNPKQNEETLKLTLLEHLYKNGDDLIEVYELQKKGKEIPSSLKQENDKKYVRYGGDKQDALKDSQYFPQIIDVSSSMNQTSGGGGGIDWGGFEIISQSGNLETSKAEDYGFEVIDESKPVQRKESEIVTKDTILASFDSRNEVIANLNELLFFVQQRTAESGASAGNTILQAYEQGENAAIFEVSKDKLTKMQNNLNSLMEILSNFKARQYFILKEQQKASERMINHLNTFRITANKARDNLSGLSKRNYDLNKTIKENKDAIADLSKQTAELKTAIETEMKKLIKRDIFIIGEINKIISNK